MTGPRDYSSFDNAQGLELLSRRGNDRITAQGFSMKYICYLAGLLAVGLFCVGCYPQRLSTSPGACGVVMDANTMTAVSGAYVEVANSRRIGWPDNPMPTLDEALTNARPPKVITGTNGDFYIPRQSILVLDTANSDWHGYGTLIVLKDGYLPGLFPISDLTNADEQMTTYLLKQTNK